MRRTIVAVAIFLFPLLAQAQVRGGGGLHAGAVAHPMISAPRATPGTAAARAPGMATGVGTTAFRSAPGRIMGQPPARRAPGQRPATSSDQRGFLPDFTGVPGLGFDFVHLAAIHPGQGRNHGLHRGQNQGFFPFFDSGFLLPYYQGYSDAPQDDSASYASQGPAQGDSGSSYAADSDRPPYAGRGIRAASSYDVVVTPQNPNDAYIFVKRDGTVFFAVAYSWESGNLFYVTQEGMRRSVARDDLDLNATQQFNEQRGFSFRMPA